MYHFDPDRTLAMVLTGTGYVPGREFAPRRITAFREQGIDYRRAYTLEDFSPDFGDTDYAAYFVNLFTERNAYADVDTIIRLFEAYLTPDADDHFASIDCPTLILTGSADTAHASAFALRKQIPDCDLQVLPGAGHACQMEQPWLFDRLMLAFLERHGLHPGAGAANALK